MQEFSFKIICITPENQISITQGFTFVGGAQVDQSVSRRVLEGQVQLVFITPESSIYNMAYREMLLSKR